MTVIRYFIVFMVSFWLFSCEKTITIKQQPYKSKLSIQGLITPNKTPQIYLNRTLPYFDPKVNVRDLTVDDAIVSLSYDNTTLQLNFDSAYNFHYCRYDYFYDNPNTIRNNTTYTLNVSFKDKIYSAQATTNQSKIGITSTGFVHIFKDLYGEHEGVIVGYTDQPGEENYYRYEMKRMLDSSVKSVDGVKSSCTFGQKYAMTEIGRTIYADKNVEGQALTFTFEPNYAHKKNDTAYLRLQSVDKNMYTFYNNLDKQKLAQYNPFVEPVFVLPGQFKDAIGVFGAYAVSDSVIFIYPE
jgi:hypothetical protein